MSKKKVPVKVFIDNLEQLTTDDIIKSSQFKDALKKQTPIRIKDALDNKESSATLFEIGNSNEFIVIPKRNFSSALESCLNWYIEEENYVECNNIKKLISECNKTKTSNNGATTE